MAAFPTDPNGGIDDRVRIELGNDEAKTIERYTVRVSVLQQPSSFQVNLGDAGKPADLIKRYPPRTPFKLYIGNVLQQSGWTDGQPQIERGPSGTSVVIKGRDALAPLHDGQVTHEFSFKDETYKSLVEKIAKEAFTNSEEPGKGSPPPVIGSNLATRKIRAGVPVVELAPPRTIEEILIDPKGAGTVGVAHVIQQAKLGESYLGLARRYLDRAGLFLWASPDGKYVLSAPNAAQKPTYRIVDPGNAESISFKSDTVPRYSHIVVYGRGGGRKNGRAKSKGAVTDDEMINWGFYKPLRLRDVHTQNTAQAEYVASRKLAEGRRAGWELVFKVTGHTAPSLVGGGRAVWTPDTIVDLYSETLGLFGEYYLESVEYSRGPETSTTLRLMRVIDLLFGGEEA